MLIYPDGKTASDYEPGAIPDYRNNSYYNTSHTRREIAAFLQRAKGCIRDNRFIVLDNPADSNGGHRQKNRDFMVAYGLYTKEVQRDFLLAIDVDDFCHSVASSDGRELYVFCCSRSLYRSGSGPRHVWVYIKHDCQPNRKPYDVVVSLHELEKPIELLFVD